MERFNRRSFIQKTGAGLLVVGLAPPTSLLAHPELTKLTILHTNDVHSRIEPFPMDGGKYQGLGGTAKRAALIDKIRAKEKNVLLFDCGDILQGTPYFNFYGGELEFELMNRMKYDAATIGNHDFDAGIEKLGEHISNANFPFLSANYNFDDTILNKKLEPYTIFEKSGLKIGVLGVGIKLGGLVPPHLFKETKYQDPIEQANLFAQRLKHELGCHFVVCLSHLGYRYDSNKVSDVVLAQSSKDIDLILGGHTHTFMEVPDRVKNQKGKPVIINQVGWAGIQLGRLDFWFSRKRKKYENIVQNIDIE